MKDMDRYAIGMLNGTFNFNNTLYSFLERLWKMVADFCHLMELKETAILPFHNYHCDHYVKFWNRDPHSEFSIPCAHLRQLYWSAVCCLNNGKKRMRLQSEGILTEIDKSFMGSTFFDIHVILYWFVQFNNEKRVHIKSLLHLYLPYL